MEASSCPQKGKKMKKNRTSDSFSPPGIVSEIPALGFSLLRNIYSFLFFEA